MTSDQILWTADAIAAIPILWACMWLFVGGITGRNAVLTIGWPFCWIGLASVAYFVLRVTEVFT